MSEKVYDEEIAPKLAEIGKLCEQHGMSFAACVEYAPDCHGRTVTLAKGSSFAMRLVDAATRSWGNVDTLFFALSKYAAVHGHSSFTLHRLGVPNAPDRSITSK